MIIIYYKAPTRCPVCNSKVLVTKLACTHCRTKVEGEFSTCKFCQLPDEQLEFVEIFVKCRGNIRDVEKELGISYPTVRGRLEAVIQALGYTSEKLEAREEVKDSNDLKQNDRKQEILKALEAGEITAGEAAQQLRKISK